MRVIYLDIDGVLNSYEDHQYLTKVFEHSGNLPQNIVFYCGGNYVEQNKLELLHEIISMYDVKVVVVSSWVCGRREGRDICKFLDVPYHSEPLCSGGGVGRGRGVVDHAAMHGISDYLIIDDSEQMYENTERLIHIDGKVGITKNDVNKIGMVW